MVQSTAKKPVNSMPNSSAVKSENCFEQKDSNRQKLLVNKPTRGIKLLEIMNSHGNHFKMTNLKTAKKLKLSSNMLFTPNKEKLDSVAQKLINRVKENQKDPKYYHNFTKKQIQASMDKLEKDIRNADLTMKIMKKNFGVIDIEKKVPRRVSVMTNQSRNSFMTEEFDG